jgi:hypothetical protein
MVYFRIVNTHLSFYLVSSKPPTMLQIYAALFSLLLLFSNSRDEKKVRPAAATCYGYTPCTACTSCNYCKYCNSGGTCGICKSSKQTTVKKDTARSVPVYVPKPSYSSQCRATTKKGTKCSRSSRSGGYCWQHGG